MATTNMRQAYSGDFRMFWGTTKQVELVERGLPLWLPFALNTLHLEIENFGRANDA